MTVAALDPAFGQISEQASEPTLTGALPALRTLVLARTACEDGITRAELARDLAFVGQSVATRIALDTELSALVRAEWVTENRSRFQASAPGYAALATELGGKPAAKGKLSWANLRDQKLVARALNLQKEPAARIKGLAKPEQLRAEILGSTFGFKIRGAAASPASLRSDLAVVALERAFGHSMKSAVSAKSGLSAKTARLLAGELLKKPRDAGTDSRLVTLLAAEAVGATKTDADALRLALLRRFVTSDMTSVSRAAIAPSPPAVVTSPAVTVIEQPTPEPAPPVAAERPPAASRPGLEGFAVAVNTAASTVSEGWPGNRKALVSRVWNAIAARHPNWGLSAIEFKAMLAEAHRTGHLALATADLKDKRQLRELQDSAITYKNTVWHLVRVQD